MFELHFATDNAAFEDAMADETARILRRLAKRIENGEFVGNVVDVNGNCVGHYSLDARTAGDE